MSFGTNLRTLLLVLALLVAPLGAGRAQNIEAPPRAYVVAFGLSDELNVFHTEASRGAAILARAYGHGTSPVVYSNTKGASRATVANLRAALTKAAARMNRDNDVLFVFLTSHGSPQGVAIDAGRRHAILPPAAVGELLRETGVRHKVLIVSACYSGVFIPLADAGTLVITAADATHPSFGCEKTATWTYFGRALFTVGIPKTDTLRDAFLAARGAVSARERKEGFAPSNPQMAGGQSFAESLHAEHAQEAPR